MNCGDPPVPTFSALESQMYAFILRYFWDVGDQNPGPHVYRANSSPTEDLTSPWTPPTYWWAMIKYALSLKYMVLCGYQHQGDQQAEALWPYSIYLLLNSVLPQGMRVLRFTILIFQMWRSCTLKAYHGSNEPNECTLPHPKTLYFL